MLKNKVYSNNACIEGDLEKKHKKAYRIYFKRIEMTNKMWPYSRIYYSNVPYLQPQMYVKPEGAITVSELLMMSRVSLKTCWAIKEHWNNKFYYTVASCWSFLYTLYYDAQNHEHQGYIFFSFITKLQYAMKSTFF